ncbi:hypothetical protein ABT390_02330 [Streptomyces aurantiacus]|uniref:hypothetical protein n=1 Tax=Streptomyces aurantiacus TaxID=47760 RepID=UPI001319C194|nr:hypothetical protein [Streptomyces aurantiacus]
MHFFLHFADPRDFVPDTPRPHRRTSRWASWKAHREDRYPRPLELRRGDPPLVGLRANGLWLTRPEAERDAIWVAPALSGVAAEHTLAHEVGHIALGHEPVVLPAEPEPKPYQYLSSDFLGGCLIGRTRSQEGPQDPKHIKVEDQAERIAFALRRTSTTGLP